MKYLGAPQSGSQANTTASRNKGGQYYRNRSMPTQPRTSSQTGFRANFGTLSTAWAVLTDAQRMAWNAYATTHSRVDSLGQSIKLSGFQQWMACNTFLALLGIPTVDAPPLSDDVPSVESVVLNITASGAFDVDAIGVNPVTGTLAFYCSPPFSAGVSFCRDFRFMKYGPAVAGELSADVAVQYVAKFGSLSAIGGKKIFVKVVPFNEYGVQGASATYSAVVAA